MSKFNPNHLVAPIYDAAARWKDQCLRADNSIFSDNKSLWISSLLDELDQRFVKNLDEGEGDFLSKLKTQLSAGSPKCRQLMAETIWLLLLFPSNIGATKKRENVHEVWSWSGSTLDKNHSLLADAVLEGIGSAGTAYNTHRWRELVFLIGALRDLKRRVIADREVILLDPWSFSEWLSSQPEARHRQLIHIHRSRPSRASVRQRNPGRYRYNDSDRAALEETLIADTSLRSDMKGFIPSCRHRSWRHSSEGSQNLPVACPACEIKTMTRNWSASIAEVRVATPIETHAQRTSAYRKSAHMVEACRAHLSIQTQIKDAVLTPSTHNGNP